MNRTDKDTTKRVFGCSTLFTNLVLSFLGLRLIRLSLAGFNRFLSSYRFIYVLVPLHE